MTKTAAAGKMTITHTSFALVLNITEPFPFVFAPTCKHINTKKSLRITFPWGNRAQTLMSLIIFGVFHIVGQGCSTEIHDTVI